MCVMSSAMCKPGFGRSIAIGSVGWASLRSPVSCWKRYGDLQEVAGHRMLTIVEAKLKSMELPFANSTALETTTQGCSAPAHSLQLTSMYFTVSRMIWRILHALRSLVRSESDW